MNTVFNEGCYCRAHCATPMAAVRLVGGLFRRMRHAACGGRPQYGLCR